MILWLDAKIYITKAYPSGKKNHITTAAIIVALFTILSVVVHEVAHAWVANLFGITIVSAGIHGLGAFVAPSGNLTEFGWFAEFAVAFAGPLSNIILALIAAFYVRWQGESLHENTVQYFGYINTRLARMNLWPIFILDGAKVVHALAWAVFGVTAATWITAIAGGVTIFWLFNKKKGRKEIEDWFMTA